MGLKHSSSKKLYVPQEPKKKSKKPDKISPTSFEFLSIVGRGGFGKVWKVYHKKTKKIYAMKKMSKTKIIDKRSVKSIMAERDLLSIMNHPFIINMHFSFQDNEYLYIAMDLLTGGDLRYHICKKKKFSEEQTKFFISCILLSLEYIHYNKILHRDLKPENLVLDENGYLKLTDFGIAKFLKKDNHKETSGTPGYMAPEVMAAQNHTMLVDFFALGVIGYELMNGIRPYLGKSRKEVKEKIFAKQVQIKNEEIPENWSLESADFINKLLQRKPNHRLGYRGILEVKEHLWFKNYEWKKLYLMQLRAKFIPKSNENIDFRYCNAPDKIGISTQERYQEIMSNPKFKETFIDFKFFNRNDINKDDIKVKIVNPHLVYLKNKNCEDDEEFKDGDNNSELDKDNKNNLVVSNHMKLNKEDINCKRPMSSITKISENNMEKIFGNEAA